MKFQLEATNRGASNDDLLEDLRQCASQADDGTISSREYQRIGRFHQRTFAKRFGSWSRALQLAGLAPKASEITDDNLFENIRTVWMSLGRQPRFRELRQPTSRYSAKVYRNRFGTLSETLRRFIAWSESDETRAAVVSGDSAITAKGVAQVLPLQAVPRRTRRDVTERQRFRVLLRDGFRCLTCGSSPLREPGVELHVDHIVPWSDGGETTDNNLETKCSRCNLGKGNAFHA
jgi:hypothetical protein